MITRRSVLLAGGVGLLGASLLSGGQRQSKTPRIGVLWVIPMADPLRTRYRSVFVKRLAELGYVEGKNILIEERSAEGHAENLGELARALGRIARHRGFRSNAKRDAAANSTDETSKMKKGIAATQERLAQYRTIGELFALDPDYKDRKHNRGLNFDRLTERCLRIELLVLAMKLGEVSDHLQ